MNVRICSRKEIQKLIYSRFPENTAAVSFYGEGEKPVYFPQGINHLRLDIDDLGASVIKDPDNYHIDDFRRIARFILSCNEKGMDIICQCEAGISRSAGTAAAILEFYDQNGISVFADYHYCPNQVFYNNLLRCLKEEGEKRSGQHL